MTNWIVVAVDGEAASGKGTISKQVCHRLNLKYLDTGKLYRALAYYLIDTNQDVIDATDSAIFFHYLAHERPSDAALQSDTISMQASKIASLPWVRALLLDYQHTFARDHDKGFDGCLLDGRDIGTVVCPNADAKLFVTANVEIRAARRHAQLAEMGEDTALDKVLTDLRKRDEADKNRANSPLVPADDALVIDTSNIAIKEAVEQAITHIQSA